jgi:hypothetical protein
LTRIVDTRALPGTLERAATLLQASGLILWVADPDGRELAPIIAHGYPQNLVARLGTIDREADNVTAAAFRTGLVQTAKAEGTFPGAIAAPLLTPTGPVGVMAAEVLNDADITQVINRDEARAVLVIPARFGAEAASGRPGEVQVIVNGSSIYNNQSISKWLEDDDRTWSASS